MYIYIYVYIYVNMYVYNYIYIYKNIFGDNSLFWRYTTYFMWMEHGLRMLKMDSDRDVIDGTSILCKTVVRGR